MTPGEDRHGTLVSPGRRLSDHSTVEDLMMRHDVWRLLLDPVHQSRDEGTPRRLQISSTPPRLGPGP